MMNLIALNEFHNYICVIFYNDLLGIHTMSTYIVETTISAVLIEVVKIFVQFHHFTILKYFNDNNIPFLYYYHLFNPT